MSESTNSRSQPNLFRVLCEDAIMAVAVFESETKACVFVNKMAREILEIPQDLAWSTLELKGMYPTENRDAKPDWRPLTAAMLEQAGLHQDIIVRKHSDRLFIADVCVHHTEVGAARFVTLMFRDITFQKKLQRDLTAKQLEIQTALQELQEQNKALLALDRAKDKFIALTTHELRTPLSAMIATAEVLHLKIYDGDEQRDQFIQTIHEEGQHLLEIVNDILDFSKIQAGKMDFFVEETSPHPLVDRMVESFKQMAESKGVSLNYQSSGAETNCFLDPLRFKQVFSNVLNNAVKFTASNTAVSITLQVSDSHVTVVVADQGPGIAPENFSKVFDEFETVGNVVSHHKGTGLGMPISKKLIERMGGKIWFESQVGQGTQFYISLPRTKVLDEQDYRARPDYNDDLAAA